ncbi:MAG: hypothetical protein QM811_16530 [Pirellulales bacterium]
MCNFLSAIYCKGGRIITAPEYTDSHSDLIAAYNLRDDGIHIRGWVRVEFTPPSVAECAEPAKYTLRLDETSRPDWFDKAAEFDCTERLREKIAGMIITDERQILLGGCWILAGDAIVKVVKGVRVYAMLASSNVGEMS